MPRSSKREPDEAEVIVFRDAAEFQAWLAENVDRNAGVWLKIAKKGSGVASLTDDQAVDVGLCYGWISGQRRALDEVYYLQKYVPRRPRSRWSQVNVRKVEELMAAGRMQAPGLAEVEAAKADGRWDAAYTSQKDATVPPDLAEALASSPVAASVFESLSKTDQYAVILDVVTARNPETRTAHVRKAITALEARAD
ncbi:MAG TPA: YdeI/OmpD-associated family protein [Propionibacteriaceae bacterium]